MKLTDSLAVALIAVCELDVAVPMGVAFAALPGRVLKVLYRFLSREGASEGDEESGREAAVASSVTA